MRGQRIYKEIIKEPGLTNTLQKGRNNALLRKRNECLSARFYYYGQVKHKCFEDTVRSLVNEFYLSPNTVCNIIREHAAYVQHLKQQAPTTSYFQNRWAHLRW